MLPLHKRLKGRHLAIALGAGMALKGIITTFLIVSAWLALT